MENLSDMSQPAQYPNNDSEESKSIKVLLNLLDEEWVKDHFEKRDKKPNTDGTIELVDLKSVPTGKLDVQIKTLRSGAKSFQCSTKLFAYSRVTTAPLLLICVDGDNNVAYWKHIHPDMKEAKGKQGQKSFVVTFDGSIDASKVYIIAWKAICERFQSRLLTGSSIAFCSMQVTRMGFALSPRWEPELWHILLPIEKNKKDLKAAIKYAQDNSASGWNDFMAALQALVATCNNANLNGAQFELNVTYAGGSVGFLRYNSAILFFEIFGAVITLEFRLDGKSKGNEGEVSWYIPKKIGLPGKLNWFDIKNKSGIGNSQDLAQYCITRLTQLSP